MAEDTSIQLQITRSGRKRKFESLDAVVEWLNAERQAWASLIGQWSPHSHTPSSLTGRLITSELDRLKQTALEAHGAEEAQRQALRSAFETAYSSMLIGSGSADGRFVLADGTPEEQAARYLSLTNAARFNLHPNTTLSGSFWIGIAEGVLHRHGLGQSAAKKAAEELSSLTTEQGNALLSLHEEQTRALDALRGEKEAELNRLYGERTYAFDLLANSLRDATAAATAQQADAAQGFETLLADWKSRLDGWEGQLKQRLGLEAPMTYWAAKSKRHRTTAVIAGGAASLLALAFGALFIWLTSEVLTTDALNRSDYARIVTLATVATLMVWMLRILVRVLLSELHLRNDAAERKVILETYTALDANDDGSRVLTDEDRRLMLAAVFRPAATGIVSDDSAPFGLAEIVSRVNPRP